jgi:trehalose-6-phosphate synthase
LLVNPYHTRAVAEAIRMAYEMPISEQRKRMRKLRFRIGQENIFWWRREFCSCRDDVREESESLAAAASAMATTLQFPSVP